MAKEYPIFQIDAFTTQLFAGNPAAVVPLDRWLDEGILQAIAAENNLSETAFIVRETPDSDTDFAIRWFTPTDEVDLCGHATLAAAVVVFDHLGGFPRPTVRFRTRSAGDVQVSREGDRLVLDFPQRIATPAPMPEGLEKALGCPVREYLRARKNLAVLESEKELVGVHPDFEYLRRLEGDGLILTAPGESSDCVSRYFAPHVGIPEDPVTGSAHCTIVPYWAKRLGRDVIHARQLSHRTGELFCRMGEDRVYLGGDARLYMKGTLYLP